MTAPMSTPPRLAFSEAEVATALGVGLSTIKRKVKDGTLKTVNLDRRVLITKAELDRFVAELPANARERP